MDSVDLKQAVIRLIEGDMLPDHEYARLLDLYGAKDPVREYWDERYPTFGGRLAKLFRQCYDCPAPIKQLHVYAPILLQKGLFWAKHLTLPMEADTWNGEWESATDYIHQELLRLCEVEFVDVDPWAAAPFAFLCTVPKIDSTHVTQDPTAVSFVHQKMFEFLTVVMKWILSYVVSNKHETRPDQLRHLIDLTAYGNVLVGITKNNDGGVVPVVYTGHMHSSVRIKQASVVVPVEPRAVLVRP